MAGTKLVVLFLFLSLWGRGVEAQQVHVSDTLVFSGIVFNAETGQAMENVHCRLGNTGMVSDRAGQFMLRATRGDSISFSYVGFKPYVAVIPDSLYHSEYVVGIFMSPDTILLSEVVFVRRFDDTRKRYLMNARNNLAGAMKQAFAPVKEMDAAMNQQMMIDKFARSVEMRGHVDVGLGVGTQSLDAYSQMRLRKKMEKQQIWLDKGEIDLLKKIYYIEKRKNKNN